MLINKRLKELLGEYSYCTFNDDVMYVYNIMRGDLLATLEEHPELFPDGYKVAIETHNKKYTIMADIEEIENLRIRKKLRLIERLKID